MSISEIRCYHNSCPKRKFFNFLPIDHIFIYATLGRTDAIYAAIGYCILQENHTLTPPSIRNKFDEIAPELSPIRVFLKGEEKPKYWESLNALAFKYEIEMRNGEEKEEIVLSFYLALRKKCGFEHENIREIKVSKEDKEKTKETAFLDSLDVGLIEEAIKQLEGIDVTFIEEATNQPKSINVYEGICLKKDVTEEYEEEEIPINKFKRTTTSKQKEDLSEFFDVFLLPSAYPTESLEKELQRMESEEEQPGKKYKRIHKELRSIRPKQEYVKEYRDILLDVERFYAFCLIDLKRFDKEPGNALIRSDLSITLRDFHNSTIAAEEFLSRSEKYDECY